MNRQLRQYNQGNIQYSIHHSRPTYMYWYSIESSLLHIISQTSKAHVSQSVHIDFIKIIKILLTHYITFQNAHLLHACFSYTKGTFISSFHIYFILCVSMETAHTIILNTVQYPFIHFSLNTKGTCISMGECKTILSALLFHNIQNHLVLTLRYRDLDLVHFIS